MPDIIAVGEILVEIMASRRGQSFLETGTLLGPYPSGAPAITADQAALAGASCAMIASVGDDDFGRLNLMRLQNDGLDISGIKIKPGYATGAAFVAYDNDGGRQFIYHFERSAAGALSAEDVSETLISRYKYLHICGCSLCAGAALRDAVLKAVRGAEKNGVKISFDPNLRPELLSGDAINEAFTEIISKTSILLTGRSELGILFPGRSDNDVLSLLRGSDGVLVIKDGKNGAKIASNSGVETVRGFSVNEVDPTGAGDCFNGAFLARLCKGDALRDAALYANAAGALSVTKQGPMSGHACDEIEKLIKLTKGDCSA